MSRRLIVILTVLVALLGVVHWWNPGEEEWPEPQRPRIRSVSRPAVSSANPDKVDPRLAAEVLPLEAARRQAWEGPLAAEAEAQRHEAVVLRLWDALRDGRDPQEMLGAVEFESLEVLLPGESVALGDGVHWQPADTNRLTWNQSEWRSRLAAWRSGGWRLEGSEWRHTRFQPDTNGALSRFEVEFHLATPAAERRRIARGVLEVRWRPAEPADEPVPLTVKVAGMEWLTRGLDPRYELAAHEVIAPENGNIFIDPLLVADLDGDGRDEIILAGKNRVYRNQGKGVFAASRLIPGLDTALRAAVIADLDRDGHADLLAADNQGLLLFRGAGQAEFSALPSRQPLPELHNPYVITVGDVDGDGDLDAWLAQYKVPYRFGQMPTPYFDAHDGFPSYLLLNDGRGRFTDATAGSGLAGRRLRRTYSASFGDLDGDGDLDLVNVSDFAGVDVFLNDGKGRFTEATGGLGERRMFGMAHALADLDDDGNLDLFAVGMNSAAAARLDALGLTEQGFPQHAAARAPMIYGNRVWLGRPGGLPVPAPWNDQVAAAGWAWGVAVFDADNSGGNDLYLANGHRSRALTRDYDPQFWLHDIYLATSEVNPVLDLYFAGKASRHYGAGESYGGHHRNVFFQQSPTGWHNTAWLHGIALPEDSRNVVAADLDGNGLADLVVLTEEVWPEERQTMHLFRNRGASGNWLAVRLREEGGGRSPWGAKVTLRAGGQTRSRWFVTGDGYRSQSPPVAHFGLGRAEQVEWVEVTWPGGTTRRLEQPAINQVHLVRAGRPGAPSR